MVWGTNSFLAISSFCHRDDKTSVTKVLILAAARSPIPVPASRPAMAAAGEPVTETVTMAIRRKWKQYCLSTIPSESCRKIRVKIGHEVTPEMSTQMSSPEK